jgi:hypothetical protein
MSDISIPKGLRKELIPVAREIHRLHEAVKWSAQGQFEQMKLWRALNLLLGAPAAALAAISGGTGLAAQKVTATPAILALISAGFGAALTTLNPSRRVTASNAAANAYLELQTAFRQLLMIRLEDMSKEEGLEAMTGLSDRRDEVNRTADPPSRYAFWLSKRNLKAGGQDYDVDQEAEDK